MFHFINLKLFDKKKCCLEEKPWRVCSCLAVSAYLILQSFIELTSKEGKVTERKWILDFHDGCRIWLSESVQERENWMGCQVWVLSLICHLDSNLIYFISSFWCIVNLRKWVKRKYAISILNSKEALKYKWWCNQEILTL